jgi:hypothetical protein
MEAPMSAAVKVTRLDSTPAKLRALAARSRDSEQTRRLLAIAMVLKGRRGWVRLHEKGGKEHEVPCHHTLEKYLDE